MMAMRGRSGKQLLVTLDIDGRDVPALMREVQNDVIAGTPIHADFSEVSLSQKVRVVVPIRLVGEAVGVKIGGGVLQQTLRSVEVECLPTDIAEKFDIDVSNLGVDQTFFVRDLQLGDKFTVVTRGELALAVVKASDDDGKGGKGGEKSPDVIKKGKEEKKA
jgi:large subunit ribosomal protein L25